MFLCSATLNIWGVAISLFGAQSVTELRYQYRLYAVNVNKHSLSTEFLTRDLLDSEIQYVTQCKGQYDRLPANVAKVVVELRMNNT